jgi:molybdopterin/thiamine biosynthesis adenylyltransferase
MSVHPKLKPVSVQSLDGRVVIWSRALTRIHLADPTGGLADLLRLLAEGTRTASQLSDALTAVEPAEVEAVLATLDEMGLLTDGDHDAALDPAMRARHQSNLRFYDLFARLERPASAYVRTAHEASVLLLGAGGVGSGVLQSLVGLGVGAVTIVDDDTVEVKNLARQFVYGLSSIGRPKVEVAAEWAAAYSTGTAVTPVRRRVRSAADIVELGTAAGADLVVCAIDTPDDIHLMVNEACFALGRPYVVGGLNYSTLSYWSVEPGAGPCRRCLESRRDAETATQEPILRSAPLVARVPVNRATGPIVQLVSGFMAMEAMRYLTRSDEPVARAAYQIIELADGMAPSVSPWERDPACPLCASAALEAVA